MTDKRFAIAVIACSAAVLAALLAIYVLWANRQEPPVVSGQPPTTQIAIAVGHPPGTTWPAERGVRVWPAFRKEPSLYPVQVGGKFGYIDESGRVAIAPTFAKACPFDENDQAAVSDGRRWGVIDMQGQWVLRPTCDAPVRWMQVACELKEGERPRAISGRALVADGSRPRRFGYLDELFVPAIPATFVSARPFSEGLAAAATQPDRWGFIAPGGQWYIPPRYEHVRDFHGFAAAVWVNGKMGFIDGRGRLAVEPEYDLPPGEADHSDFSGRMAAVRIDGRWGYINRKGEPEVEPKYEAARTFSGGYAAVKLGGKWGFIDTLGRMIIEPAFADVDPSDEGDGVYRGGFRYAGGQVDDPRHDAPPPVLLAPVATPDGWGFVGEDGQFVVRPQYKAVGPFRGRLARVVTDAGAGYIDPAGRIVFSPSR